jgi:hypothetical protein
VGKPNERERDLLFSFRKVHISSKITFPAKENTSQHQICPTEICLVFHAKTVLLYGLLRTSFSMPTVSCTDCSVRPRNNHKNSEIHLENRARNASISVPNPYDCTDCTDISYCTDPYSTASHNRKIFRPKTHRKKFSWDSCPPSLENVPSLLLTFLSQAYSENLSNSSSVFSTFDMSCTLPNAFFYNLKMTFSPQSVFSPSPTLDPKAKIRSCLFQDQGS